MRVRKEEIERIVASDPAEHVRIVAAEALVGLGEPVDAVKLLARLADDDNALAIRIQAFDGLSNIGRAAIPALPVIRKAANAKLRRFVDPEYAKRWRCIWSPRWRAIITRRKKVCLRKPLKMLPKVHGPPPSAVWSS